MQKTLTKLFAFVNRLTIRSYTMKISQTNFKNLLLISSLFLFVSCSPKITEIEDGSAVPKQKEQITTHFSGAISGSVKPYSKSTEITLSDIQKERDLVWKVWKEANSKSTEQKLIPLEALSNGKSDRWNLPSYLEPSATMPYYFGSKGTKPEAGFPLYLYLHGSGDKNSEWNTGLSLNKNFNDAPSVYFIPQIPNTGNYYRWWQKAKQFAWEKMLRLAFVSGQIDANKVYCVGISEGGYGSQRLASFYADYLAGAGPMAGGEPLKNAPVENCRNTAFSLLTGALDDGFYRNKLTGYTKDEFEKFNKLYPADFTHRIELIPNMGHSINYNLTTPWLKQFTRNPYPKAVNWENYEMDGLYRKGFYNLAVQERSNADESTRTYYQTNIQGNEIDIKVDLVTYKAVEVDPNWGIELKSEKSHQTASKGKFTVYLNSHLVDLEKEVTLTVNGKQAFKGMLKPDLKHLVNSCATFFDPERLYPAAIEVDLEKM